MTWRDQLGSMLLKMFKKIRKTGVGGWQKPVLGGKAPLGCFGLGRGSRGREWVNVKEALPKQPPHAYFILSLSKFYEHLVLAPKSIQLRGFFTFLKIYLGLTTSRICCNSLSFFLPPSIDFTWAGFAQAEPCRPELHMWHINHV